jgi:hypothetical protein
MDDDYRFRSWLVDGYGWARMSPPAAVLVLASLPLFPTDAGAALILAYTLLPAYMVHQYEEHARGRFAAFANSEIAHGREMLTRSGAFWINVLGVWALFLALFYQARYAAVGFALGAIYATVINGLTHALGGAALRGYNPGLYTSLALFLPSPGGYRAARGRHRLPAEAAGQAAVLRRDDRIELLAARGRLRGAGPSESSESPERRQR